MHFLLLNKKTKYFEKDCTFLLSNCLNYEDGKAIPKTKIEAYCAMLGNEAVLT